MKIAYNRPAKTTTTECQTYWQHFGGRLANLAQVVEGTTVLDVGTGSGSVLIPAAKRTGVYGLGIGVDINIRGLRLALPEIENQNLRNIALAQMDAGNLAFPDDTFDCILAGFVGWSDCFDFEQHCFTGPETQLAEISRVLKTGGRAGISSWIEQEDLDWLGYQFQKFLPGYSAERGIGSSWTSYGKENTPGYEIILKEGDFRDIEITTETEDFVSTDEEEWWQQMRYAGWWVQIDQLASADAGRLAQFKTQVFESLQEHKQSDGIHFSKTALFAFGRKK